LNALGEKEPVRPKIEEEVPERLVLIAAIRTAFFVLAYLPLIVGREPEPRIALPIALAGLLFFCGVPLPRIPGLAVRVGLFFFVLGAALEAWIYVNQGLITRFWHAYALISLPSIAIFGIWLLFRSHQRLNIPGRAIAELLVSATLGCFLAAASSSAGAPGWMVEWFIHTIGLSPDAAYTTTIILRKIVHFTYFGLIALFAFQGALRISSDHKRSVLFALLWVATFAAFDELSQLASPMRTGSILDFALDMLGSIIFVSVAWHRAKPQIEPSEWKVS